MKKTIKFFIKIISLSLCLTLIFVGCKKDDRPAPSAVHKFVYSNVAEEYGYINIGSCKKLTGEVYTLVIFVDDTEGSWSPDARSNFYSKRYFPSINYLNSEAKERNIKLNIQNGKYETTSDRVSPIIYGGKVANSAANASLSLDLLNYAAKEIGFTDAAYMDTILKKNLGVPQIAYVIALNKPGRAYAVMDNTYDDNDAIEFLVVFSQDEKGNDSIGSSVLHELLHLFGATDLYDDGGGYTKRYELCKKLYPNDIMMRSSTDIKKLEIGYLTEALIGWSEFFPAECDCPEWWEQSEEVAE